MVRGLAAVMAVTLLLVAGFGVGLVVSAPAGGGGRSPSVRFAPATEPPIGPRPTFHRPLAAPPIASPATTIIEPNGSISNASAPITRSGSVYTVTSNFSGPLLVERNDSRVTSGDSTVTGTDPAVPTIEVYGVRDATIDHLAIGGTGGGLMIVNSVLVSATDVTVAAATGITVLDSQSTNVQNATVAAAPGVGILVQGSEGTLVADTNASDRSSGVTLDNALNATIIDDDLVGCQIGINASSDSQITARDDRLSGTQVGVVLVDVASISLAGDVAVAPGIGLEADESTFLNATGEAYVAAGTGVSLVDSYGVNLTDSNLTGDGQAAVAVSSGGLTLARNDLTGFGASGIRLQSVTSARLSENAISASSSPNGVAIESIDSANLLEFDNVADFDPTGILDIGGVNVTLSDNILAHSGGGGAAVALENDAQITAFQNDFTNISQVSLSASGVRAAKISENYAAITGGQGIAVGNSSAISITDNVVHDAGPVGLSVENSSDCELWGNTVLWTPGAAPGTAILAAFDASPRVVFNNLSAARLAVAIFNTTNASVIDNNASHSGTGLSLQGDANAVVVANDVWFDNLSFAVAADLDVSIYHNNFGQNGGWTAVAGPELITWSAGYPEGGNFWSNHTGPDVKSGADQAGQGADGIVDLPMDIGFAGSDPYPLTTPWIPSYAVFAESGLLSATPWSLIVNGERLTSVAPGSIFYAETNSPNATVAWTVVPVPGFTLAGVAVGGPWPEQRGINLSYSIAFYADRFPISFQEYGLAPGTPWTFIVNGQPEGGEAAGVTVSLPNGTYSYLAGGVAGYNLTVGAGEVTVAGPGATVLIVYVAEAARAASTSSPGATVEFLATGLALAGFIALAFLALYLRERRRSPRPPPLRAAGAEPSSNVRDGGRQTG